MPGNDQTTWSPNPLNGASRGQQVLGGDKASLSPVPIKGVLKSGAGNPGALGRDPSTWSPNPIGYVENPGLPGGDPSTWSPNPLDATSVAIKIRTEPEGKKVETKFLIIITITFSTCILHIT